MLAALGAIVIAFGCGIYAAITIVVFGALRARSLAGFYTALRLAAQAFVLTFAATLVLLWGFDHA